MAKANLSPEALQVLSILEDADSPMTLADIKEIMPNANPAHLTALANRGKVSANKIEKTVVREVKTKVNEYTFAEVDEADEADAE